jgi:lipocalin
MGKGKKSARMTTAKYSCGHEQNIRLTGSQRDKEKKLALKLAKGKCRECYGKK